MMLLFLNDAPSGILAKSAFDDFDDYFAESSSIYVVYVSYLHYNEVRNISVSQTSKNPEHLSIIGITDHEYMINVDDRKWIFNRKEEICTEISDDFIKSIMKKE